MASSPLALAAFFSLVIIQMRYHCYFSVASLPSVALENCELRVKLPQYTWYGNLITFGVLTVQSEAEVHAPKLIEVSEVRMVSLSLGLHHQ